jgi:argininosuccinate synthase
MQNPIVLAFSGGLDTSYCIPWLAEKFGREIVTASVDTGGFSTDEASALEVASSRLGASAHYLIDARQKLFDDVIKYLIFGNVRKGEMYPLCVGAERTIQAEAVGQLANTLGADSVAHGCTAAGNDQVRFEIALRALFPNLDIIAPVRDYPVSRPEQVVFLKEKNLDIPVHGAAYSVNRGLWGTTVGGSETLTSQGTIPEETWPLSGGQLAKHLPERILTVTFEAGIPVAVDGNQLAPVELISTLQEIGSEYAIGRGIHVGDTILGIKGRVAFEAPAAEILMSAHRELEKIVLSGRQLSQKQVLASSYGELVHSGSYLDPVCRDIEAYLDSSQNHVTGSVTLALTAGRTFVNGADSEYSLMAASRSHYGEATQDWSARDAAGFCKMLSVPAALYQIADSQSEEA